MGATLSMYGLLMLGIKVGQLYCRFKWCVWLHMLHYSGKSWLSQVSLDRGQRNSLRSLLSLPIYVLHLKLGMCSPIILIVLCCLKIGHLQE